MTPNTLGSIWNTSFIAAWFAAPPIQLPAIAVMPRHSSPSTDPGAMACQSINAMGPPMTTLSAAAKNMMSAFGPSRSVAGKSIASVSRTNVAGSRYRDAMK
jgi:hypothetical protein